MDNIQIVAGQDGRLYIVTLPTHQQDSQQNENAMSSPTTDQQIQQTLQQLLLGPNATTSGLSIQGALPSALTATASSNLATISVPLTLLPMLTSLGFPSQPPWSNLVQTSLGDLLRTVGQPSRAPMNSVAQGSTTIEEGNRTQPAGQQSSSLPSAGAVLNALNATAAGVAPVLLSGGSLSQRPRVGSQSAQLQPLPDAAEAVPRVAALPDNIGSEADEGGLVANRPPISLGMDCDTSNLSAYQCLARQHIEFFQATKDYLHANCQGRNRPIVLGQVGIRCRHCSDLTPKYRKAGSAYFPSKVSWLLTTLRGFVWYVVERTSSDLCNVRYSVWLYVTS